MNILARGSANLRRASIIGMAGLGATLMPVVAIGQSTPVTNNSAGTIGPAQLRNFSLGGTPTVQAPPAQDVPPDLITPRPIPGRSVQADPKIIREAPLPSASEPGGTTAPPARGRAAPINPIVPPPQSAPLPRVDAPGAGQVGIRPPSANPLASGPTPADETQYPSISSQPVGGGGPLQQSADQGSDSMLGWVIALLAAAGVGVALLFRSRWRADPVLAGALITPPREAGPRSYPTPPTPQPLPRVPEPASPAPLVRAPISGGITVKRPDAFPQAPRVPPRSSTPAGGIVSTRLRPWLEIEFEPSRAVIDEARASAEFDVFVVNSGSAPARNVLVEACMINAGPDQDGELSRFFDAPVGVGDRIAALAPLARIALKSAVSLPLEQVRAYEVNGRRLFVPLVAFNALYEWGSSLGQTSASFMLGRAASSGGGEGDSRMAPLRLDLGPCIFRALEARRHPLAKRS